MRILILLLISCAAFGQPDTILGAGSIQFDPKPTDKLEKFTELKSGRNISFKNASSDNHGELPIAFGGRASYQGTSFTDGYALGEFNDKIYKALAVTQTGPVPKVTVVNNVAMLSFTASNVGSFQWVITPAASASIIYGGSDMAAKTVSLKSGIKYTFTLTVWDRYGNPPQTSTVVYDNSVPLVPVPKKDSAYSITLYDNAGKRWMQVTIFKDSSINKN